MVMGCAPAMSKDALSGHLRALRFFFRQNSWRRKARGRVRRPPGGSPYGAIPAEITLFFLLTAVTPARKELRSLAIPLGRERRAALVLRTQKERDVGLVPGLELVHGGQSAVVARVARRQGLREIAVRLRVRLPGSRRPPGRRIGAQVPLGGPVHGEQRVEPAGASVADRAIERAPVVGGIGGIGRVPGDPELDVPPLDLEPDRRAPPPGRPRRANDSEPRRPAEVNSSPPRPVRNPAAAGAASTTSPASARRTHRSADRRARGRRYAELGAPPGISPCIIPSAPPRENEPGRLASSPARGPGAVEGRAGPTVTGAAQPPPWPPRRTGRRRTRRSARRGT